MNETLKSVCVVGLGYIGLPSAAILAKTGYRVYGYDINTYAVEMINSGRIHIVEPDLESYVKVVVAEGLLTADSKPHEADVFIIAVPTPFRDNYKPDISFVENAIKTICPLLKDGNIIILESTSPVGTTEKIQEIMVEQKINIDKLYIAHCPERVLPGKILTELVENNRIVGGLTVEATEKVSAFYKTFVKGEVIQTNARTAEFSKLVENASRDVQIAFANELSIICDDLNIDVWEVIRLANKHPRVNILSPGPGVGGHCIAVDPWFIVDSDPKESMIIREARERNLLKTEWVIKKIEKTIDSYFLNKGIKPVLGCMGITYKADIDDLRESPSLEIARHLRETGIEIMVVEPNMKRHNDFKVYTTDEVLNKADIIDFLVSHKEFVNLRIPEAITILDFCGITNK